MICMADYEKEAAELIAQDKKHLWHHITRTKILYNRSRQSS